MSASISPRHPLSIRESHRSLYPVTGNQTIKTQFAKQNTFTITAKYEKWLVHDPVQHENHLFFEQDPIQLGEDEKFFFLFLFAKRRATSGKFYSIRLKCVISFSKWLFFCTVVVGSCLAVQTYSKQAVYTQIEQKCVRNVWNGGRIFFLHRWKRETWSWKI